MKEGERKFIMENLKDVDDGLYIMYPKIHNDDGKKYDFIDDPSKECIQKTIYKNMENGKME